MEYILSLASQTKGFLLSLGFGLLVGVLLAQCMNQKILRINNNQNTEVEEYLGSYTTDKNGNFYF